MQEQEVARKLELCVGSFKKVLYEPDDIFLKNMEKNNLAGDDISKYQLWEWTQGVGLYGLYNYYKLTGDRGTFDFLCGWYDARMAEGLPERNVNTTCPMLTLLCVYEDTQDERYGALCRDWAEWVMHGLIRTGDGAFQHMITTSSICMTQAAGCISMDTTSRDATTTAVCIGHAETPGTPAASWS